MAFVIFHKEPMANLTLFHFPTNAASTSIQFAWELSSPFQCYLPGELVFEWQFSSSVPSPQSFSPSQIQCALTQFPFAHVSWLLRQGQFSSSELSPQSSRKSQTRFLAIHLPLEHWKRWGAQDGLVVGITAKRNNGSNGSLLLYGSQSHDL